jgi:hypothetical protein
MRGQSRSSLEMARHLTGRDKGLENVIRINPPVAANRFSLDDTAGINDLRGFAYSQARHALPEIKDRVFRILSRTFRLDEDCLTKTLFGHKKRRFCAQVAPKFSHRPKFWARTELFRKKLPGSVQKINFSRRTFLAERDLTKALAGVWKKKAKTSRIDSTSQEI